MKMKNFTLNALMASLIVIAGSMTLNAQDTGTGTGWGKLSPGEPMVLNENFRGFAHFHSDANTHEGNSNNLDVDGVVVYGYTNLEHSVKYIGSEHKANYSFYQCAFAPNWDTAYGYRDSLAGTSTTATTPSVSRGFVEISRTYGASGGALPTVHGHFIIDLRNLEMVEVIQYTHSSTGGNRRGFLLEYSIDDSLTWDTLRFQPGNAWSTSFTKDIITGEKTANIFSCQPSAYGMVWEDGIYFENIMLRFSEAGGQTPRIHDFKVYGTLPSGVSSKTIANDLKIFYANDKVHISKLANVEVYSMAGIKLKSESETRSVSIRELPRGLYIVKAENEGVFKTVKIMKR